MLQCEYNSVYFVCRKPNKQSVIDNKNDQLEMNGFNQSNDIEIDCDNDNINNHDSKDVIISRN